MESNEEKNPSSGMGQRERRVPWRSDEYNQIKHYLSMCTHQIGVVTDLKIWKIDNPEMTSNFDRRTGGMLRLPSWVSTKDLPDGDTLQIVSQYGFRFDKNVGMYFSTGNISIPSLSTESETDSKVHKFVYCEVAVGRSKVCDEPVSESSIPYGFDSLYIPRLPIDSNNGSELSFEEFNAASNFDGRSPSMYSHQYFINDAMQVNPRFIVQFSLKKRQSDQPPEVDSAITLESYDYFDPILYRPVSRQEKLSNAKLSHRLIPVDKAYQIAQEESKKQDSILNNKLVWIDDKLSDIDTEVRQVNLNYAEKYDEIVSATEKALSQLQQLSKAKLELLLSAETELRREREEIEWIEGYISEKSNESKVPCETSSHNFISFLDAWKSHAVLRNGLSRAKPREVEIVGNVKPDIVVYPDILVCTEDKLPSAILSLEDKRQKAMTEEQNDEDNLSTSTVVFDDCMKEVKRFIDAAATSSGLYSRHPAKPYENLISPNSQALVDENVSKIEQALSAALEDSSTGARPIPLPRSIARPTSCGAEFPLPDNSPFSGSYNYKGDSASLTSAELQLEIEQSIRKTTNPDVTEDSEIQDEEDTPFFRQESLDGLRPLEQTNQQLREKLKSERSRSFTRQASSSSMHQPLSTARQGQSFEYVQAVEDFEGDLVSYIERATEQYRPTYSLIEGANRRKVQLSANSASFQLSEDKVFFNSEILEPHLAEPPECRILYSTENGESGLPQLFEAVEGTKGPCVLLVQSGDFVFGAYSNHSLLPTEGRWTGSPSSFLFSITFDLKFPYHGRNLPGKAFSDNPCALLVDENRIMFGNGDLHIDDALESGSSHLEGCYGFGLPRTSRATKSLLAGIEEFSIDKCEVWQILPN